MAKIGAINSSSASSKGPGIGSRPMPASQRNGAGMRSSRARSLSAASRRRMKARARLMRCGCSELLAREDVQPVTADLELVAVLERSPLDLLSVDEEAVKRAVVEGAQVALGGVDDERVAAGDGGVVEADVGIGGAADPGPALCELDCLRATAAVEREYRTC